MATGKYTRTGARRSGDDYQDVIALDILVEWLEHPERFTSIRVEDDGTGALDDVVAYRSDGSLIVRQVKFSTDPNKAKDPWSWAKLLDQEQGKKKKLPSLLQDWFNSIEKAKKIGRIENAAVVSNRRAATDVAVALSEDGYILFDQIKEQDVRQEIVRQCSTEKAARDFFNCLRFSLDYPSLETKEEGIRRRFYALGGTETGWLSLKNTLRAWVRLRNKPEPDGAIRLTDIRRAAQWYVLQSLPQEFSVPIDYVPPSRIFHKGFLRHLLAKQSGCVLLYASPGVGKSTYASYLFGRLHRHNIPVIRHHYYLAQRNDRYESERLGYRRAAESLMHDLAHNYPSSLENLDTQNPTSDRLRDWLEASGNHFSRQGLPLVIIIDGLDHVWRERRTIDELERLLGHLLPAPDGVVLLLATQPVDKDKLPPSLYRHAPSEEWIQLPLMESKSVSHWLRFHRDEIRLVDGSPVPEHYLVRVADALNDKSAGHPLHLRYTLRSLQEQGLDCTPENIRRLPGCSHQDIREYYKVLMLDLNEQSRDVLYLTTVTSFSWPRNGIVECLSSATVPEAFVHEAINKVAHLMLTDELGLRPFHSSLPAYIRSLPIYEQEVDRMRLYALEWLKNFAVEQWRWGNEWLLESDLGNSQPLIQGPTRAWAVEAIATRRTASEIAQVLNRATYASFYHFETLPRAVEIGILHDYCNRVFDEHTDITSSLLRTQLKLEEDTYLRPRLLANIDDLSNEEIAELGTAEAARGNQDSADRCIHILGLRLEADQDNSSSQRENSKNYVPQILRIFSASESPDVQRVTSYALLRPGQTRYILDYFSERLRSLRKTKAMRECLSACAEELPLCYETVLENAVLLALEEGLNVNSEISTSLAVSSPFAVIYEASRKNMSENQWQIVLPSHSNFRFGRMDRWDRPGQAEDAFRRAFFGFFANSLLNRSNNNQDWINSFESDDWIKRFINNLAQIAIEAAEQLTSGQGVSLSWLYERLTTSRMMRPQEKEDTVLFAGIAATNEMYLISLDLLAINAATASPIITTSDLSVAIASAYFDIQAWLKVYLTRARTWLDADAVTYLLQHQEEELRHSIGQFPERAEHFALLAELAALHGRFDDASRLIRQAVENLLAHGNHKDPFFFACLEVSELCYAAGITDDAQRWLSEIAPAIGSISEFTDGDETGHLPEYFADTLSKIDPTLLPAYYLWLAGQEEYADAEHAFHVFLDTCDLTQPVNQAIAATGIDNKSRRILTERADTGDAGAQQVVNSLSAYLGGGMLIELEQDRDYTTRNIPEERPFPLPADYPPEQYQEFVEALSESHVYADGAHVKAWLAYWLEAGKGEAAFHVVQERAKRRSGYYRHSDALYASALDLYGWTQAYPWLARAQGEDSGWARYFTEKERAIARWEEIRRRGPEKWHDFIRDSFVGEHAEMTKGVFISHYQVARLVEYCLLFNQKELARTISERLVQSALEIVSPIHLAQPQWVENFL